MTSKESAASSPSPVMVTFEMVGACVSSRMTWVSCSVAGFAPPLVPSMVSV